MAIDREGSRLAEYRHHANQITQSFSEKKGLKFAILEDDRITFSQNPESKNSDTRPIDDPDVIWKLADYLMTKSIKREDFLKSDSPYKTVAGNIIVVNLKK